MKTWKKFAAITSAVLSMGIGAAVLPSTFAAGPVATIVARQDDGTPSFDADNLAGHDASANNGIVRTNDYINYKPEVTSSATGDKNSVLTVTLPKGVQLEALPGFCLSGSSISPTNFPDPGANLTATSWTTLPSQTITCAVGDLSPNSTQTYSFPAKVRPEVPNGTMLAAPQYTVKSDTGTSTKVSGIVTKVSAKAQYDLSFNNSAITANTGYTIIQYKQGMGQSTFATYLPVLLAATTLKGNSPLSSNWSFDVGYTVVLSNGGDAMTAAESPFINGVWNGDGNGMPFTRGTDERSVTESGTITGNWRQPGSPITVNATGTNTTAWHTPTLDSRGTPLPNPDLGYVSSFRPELMIPVSTVKKYGVPSNGTYTLRLKWTIQNLSMTDIFGNPVTDTVPTNDYRTRDYTVSSYGGFDTYYMGYPGRTGNTPYNVFQPGGGSLFEGPMNSTIYHSLDGNTLAGQTEVAQFITNNSSTPGTTSMLQTTCLGWDATKQTLTNVNIPQTTKSIAAVSRANWPGTQGKTTAVWASTLYMDAGSSYDPFPDNYVKMIEYGNGPTTQGMGCSNSEFWSTNINDPAFKNDPNLVKSGMYTGITKVRITYIVPAATMAGDALVSWRVALTSKTGLPVGTKLPIRTAIGNRQFFDTFDQTLAVTPAQARAAVDTYTGGGSTSPFSDTTGGSQGDWLTIIEATARTAIEVSTPTSNGYTGTTATSTNNQAVDWRITPTLSLPGNAPDATRPVTSEVCLPKSFNIVKTSIAPTISQLGSPAGAEVTCPSDQMWLKFDFGQVAINATIPPIIINTVTSAAIASGNYAATTAVYSPADAVTLDKRSDTVNVVVDVPLGIKIAKSANTPFVDVAPTSAWASPMSWNITFVNTTPNPVSNVDIIDQLPKTGQNGSNFVGVFNFTKATLPAGVTMMYTKAAVVDPDPNAATNKTGGTTVWCTGLTGGTCPANLNEVTGLRFKRAGQMAGNTSFDITVEGIGYGNEGGNVYMNRTGGYATGLMNSVGPDAAPVTVKAGAIADHVWIDWNGNGIQDSGEPNRAGQSITLTGTRGSLTFTRSIVSDANGYYAFNNLPPANYTMTAATPPSGYAFTKSLRGSNTGTDSNVDSTGKYSMTLGSGIVDTTVDIGIVPIIATATFTKTTTTTTPVRQGDVVPYTFTMKNTGTEPLYNVTFSEVSFNGSGKITMNCPVFNGPVIPGATATCTGSYTVTQADVDSQKPLKNVAKVVATSSTGKTVTPPNSSATVNVVPETPAIKLVKVADKVSNVAPGQVITYTFTGTNTGNVTLNNVKIAESSFNGSGTMSALSCPAVTTIAPNATITCTATYVMTDADVRKGSTITNVGTITGTSTTGKTVTATDDATTAPRPNSGVTYKVCYGSSDCTTPVTGVPVNFNGSGTNTTTTPVVWDTLVPNSSNTIVGTIPSWAVITDVLVDGVSVGTTIPSTVTSPDSGYKNIVVVITTPPKGSSATPTPPVFESGL